MNTVHARFATQAVHAGQHPDRETGALVAPLYLTSTYVFTPEKMERFLAGDTAGMYTYGRCHNPTQSSFQDKVAVLERGGAALATGSGMAAIALAVLGTVHSGDHLIACRTVYGGTFALFSKILAELNIEVTYLQEMTPGALDAACRPNTRGVFLETVLNPTMEVLDLDPVLGWARARGLRSFVDNTFTTPYLLRPLEHGADVVVHSTTKYTSMATATTWAASSSATRPTSSRCAPASTWRWGRCRARSRAGSGCAASRPCTCACAPTATTP